MGGILEETVRKKTARIISITIFCNVLGTRLGNEDIKMSTTISLGRFFCEI